MPQSGRTFRTLVSSALKDLVAECNAPETESVP